MKPTLQRLLGYSAVTAGYLVLVWALPFFPSQDGPSHVYNLAVLHDLLHGGREWGSAFRYEPSASPNLGFHLVAYPLLSLAPPLVAEKIFLSIYMVLMACAVPLQLRSFGRDPFPLSYLLFPVLFNFTLLMGFYSYAIAVPLFVLAFSMAWRIRGSSTARRVICLNLCGAAIYYFHMVPFLMYLAALAALSWGASRSIRKGKALFLIREAAIISPLLIACARFALAMGKPPGNGLGYLASLTRAAALVADFFSFSTVSFHSWQIWPSCLLMFLVTLFGLTALKEAWERSRRGERATQSEETLFTLAAALTAVYFLAPFRFGDGGFFNQRFPWVVLLVLLPLLKVPDTAFYRRFGTALVAGCAWLSLGMNAVVLREESARVERFVAGLGHTGFSAGSCVLTYKTKEPLPRFWEKHTIESKAVDPLLHACGYYALARRCVDAGNYEAQVSYFPVRFRPDFPPTPPLGQIESAPERIQWERYPQIRHLIGWELDGAEESRLQRDFVMSWRGQELTLWQRK